MTGMGGSLNRKNVLAATLIFLFILTGILLVFFLFSVISSLWEKLQSYVFRMQKFTTISFDSYMPTEILEKVIKMHLLGLDISSLNAKDKDISLTEVTYSFLFCRKEF